VKGFAPGITTKFAVESHWKKEANLADLSAWAREDYAKAHIVVVHTVRCNRVVLLERYKRCDRKCTGDSPSADKNAGRG
jgi:hypothetical protein